MAGSNLGDRRALLDTSRQRVEQLIGRCVAYSSVYETEPWGKTDQPLFLNQAWMIESCIDEPEQWMKLLKQVERESGRMAGEKWGPRLIDIDVLLAEELVYDSPLLQIPHPRLAERRFALVPACEIAADWMHPLEKKSLEDLLVSCTDPLHLYPLKAD